MTYIRQLIMIIFAIVVFLALQYQYWFGDNGHGDLNALNKQVANQQYINNEQQKANQILYADVKDLKTGLEAVEEHARVDLGLIKDGETFVQMSTAPNIYTADSTVNPETNHHLKIDAATTTQSVQAPSKAEVVANHPKADTKKDKQTDKAQNEHHKKEQSKDNSQETPAKKEAQDKKATKPEKQDKSTKPNLPFDKDAL